MTVRRFATHAWLGNVGGGPVVRRNVAGQSLALRRRNSQVRHSGPVHRTPDTAGGLGVLNELRHIGKSFRVTLRSIHKSQGSEYPAVVIPVMTQHYAMLQRNLLYTGATRGKRLVVLVGQKKAIAIAVRNVSGGGVGRSWRNG